MYNKKHLYIGLNLFLKLNFYFLFFLKKITSDIKPDNFVIGLGKRANKIFLIDFGLAKRYI